MARKKLVQAVASEVQRQVIEAMGIPTIALPVYNMPAPSVQDRPGGRHRQGIFKQGEVVLGTARPAPHQLP